MMKKVFKILGVFICVVGLIILVKVSQNLIYSATSVTCLESKPEDSLHFGQALAITDNYIAVGDPKANKVAIYSYKKSEKKWLRTKEVYPPKNSLIDQVGNGFGYSLVFNQNQLIIGAFSEPKSTHFDEDSKNQKNEFENNYQGAVYSLLLNENKKNSLTEIALPQSIKLTGYAVTTFNNKIALGATTETVPYTKPGKVLIVNPTTLKVETTIKPPNSEKKFADFGFVIDGDEKSLLIGSRGLTRRGGALLIDQAEKLEEILSAKDPLNYVARSGSSVGLTNNLIAIGSFSGWGAINTMILRRSKEELSLIDVVNFGGTLDATESHILISADKETSMPTSTFHLIHMLAKLDRNRVKIESKIRWKWSPDFKFEAKGIIYNNRLVLSHKGKVVVLSMQHLPRNYVINKSFCKWK
jgi:hypothetical protein